MSGRPWTEHEEGILRFEWGEPIAILSAKLNRTPQSLRHRARILGLHLGKAPGREFLQDAADRTGIDCAQLRRILVSCRVRIYTNPFGAAVRWRSVDPDDVDRAVERWCRLETLQHASRRYGVHVSTVWRALHSSGQRLPPKPAFRRHWRIPVEVVDKAMETRRARSTCAGAASN